MSGIELATAYVSLVTETQGIVKAVNASLGQAERAAEQSGRNMGSKMASAISMQLRGIGGPSLGMLGVGGGIAAAIAEVEKKSADLEQTQARLVTSAGESRANLAGVTSGLIGMAGQVGISVNALSTGMYTVESAGYHGAAGLLVMQAAAQGARMEGAELRTVADAVSTAMTDYHLPASQAATVTSQLVTAVGQGKTNMEDFSSSLHSITPLAASAGISLADVTGSLAEMTSHGMSADQASQNLADTLRHMITPTQKQRAELAQLGMTSGDLQASLGQKGLAGTLDMLSTAILQRMGPDGKMMLSAFNTSKDAANNVDVALASLPASVRKVAQQFADGSISVADWKASIKDLPANQAELANGFTTIYNNAHGFTNALKSGSPQAQTFMQALAAITGDATGLNTTLMLTGENAASTAHNIDLVAHATADAHGNVKGWDETQTTFNQKLAQFGDGLEAAAERIGLRLLPPMTAALTVMGHGVTSLTTSGGALAGAAHGIGDVIGGFRALPQSVQLGIGALLAMRLASNTFGDGVSSNVTKVKEFTAGIREETAVQQQLAQMEGQEIGRAGALSAALQARSTTLATMGGDYHFVADAAGTFAAGQRALAEESGGVVGALRNASATAVDFGGRVGGAAAAGVRGMGTAVNGVVSALGGPWMVGLAVAGTALEAWYSEVAEAKSKARDAATAVRTIAAEQVDLAEIFSLGKGAFNDQAIGNITEQVTNLRKSISDAGGEHEDWIDRMVGHAGGSNRQDDLANQHQAAADAISNLNMSDQQLAKTMTDDSAFKGMVTLLRGTGDGGRLAADELDNLRRKIMGVRDAAIGTTPGYATLSSALATLADQSASADDRLNAMKSALDILSGKPVGSLEALQQYNQMARDITRSTQEVIDKTQGFGAALVGANGQIDTTTSNGDALAQKLEQMADRTQRLATAGQPLGPIFARNNQLLKGMADEFGLTTDQVHQLAASVGYLPQQITILANLQGADAVSQKLTAIDGLMKVDAGGVDIPAKFPGSDDVLARLKNIGVEVGNVNAQTGTVHLSIPPAEYAKVIAELDSVIGRASYFASATDLGGKAIPDPAKIQGPIPVTTPRAEGGIDNLPGQATIQPSGTLIQWAEPQTGGEAFIPLAPSKRQRSTAILSDVAGMFGLRLAKFAEGGVHEHGRRPRSIPDAMLQILQKRWPTMAMSAASGDGADFSDSTAEMDAAATFIADSWPQSTELIYSGDAFNRNIRGGAFVGDGIATYGAVQMRGAAAHLHWELSEMPSESGSRHARGRKDDGLAHEDTRTDQERVIDAIVAEGRRRGLPDKAITIAIGTALVESGAAVLANPAVPGSMGVAHTGTGSDHDSIGPFQQRNSWGSVQDRMDPTTSAGLFYDRLEQLPYMTMDAGAAAQAVQHSANPGAYALRMKEASDLFQASVQRLTGDTRYYDETPAPQAPALGAETGEQEKIHELERAVREANGKRNSVYNDAAASADDRDKADDDLRDALQALAQEKAHPTANKSSSGGGSGDDSQDAIQRIADVGKSFFVGELEDALQTIGLQGGVQGVLGAAINIGLDQLPAIADGTLLGGRKNAQGMNQLLQQVLGEDPSHDIGKPGKIGLYDDGGWWLPGDGAVNQSPFAEPAAVFSGPQWGTLNAIANSSADIGVAPTPVVNNHYESHLHVDRPGASIAEIQEAMQKQQRTVAATFSRRNSR